MPAAPTWFYTGENGGYEFWPDGPARPSVVLEGPFGTNVLVGDNDYMYHRVQAFGDPARNGDVTLYTTASSIVIDGEAWVVQDEARSEPATRLQT